MKTYITKEEYMQMYNIVGAAMEVYNNLGRGMEEPIYQEALDLELRDRGIVPRREVWFDAYYKGKLLKKKYKADLVINDVIVELKSVESFNSLHRAQLFNYMRLSQQKRGILINFGGNFLASERYIYQKDTDDFVLLKEYNYREYIK